MKKVLTKTLVNHNEMKVLSQELVSLRHQLLEQFYTDPLMRLPNLYKLRHDLEELTDFTLIVANIDNFKLLNDFYGFVVGDFLLESFAKSLKDILQTVTVYRIAGDEFAI